MEELEEIKIQEEDTNSPKIDTLSIQDIQIDEIIEVEINTVKQVSIKEFENGKIETYITYQSANW